MKFNVDVEIDWLEEGGTIDEEVKKQIINGISSRINKQSQEDMTKAVEKEISTKVSALLDAKMNEILEDFLKRGVKITDQWGAVKKEIVIEDLVKEKFDKFMTAKVDSDGRESDYGSSMPRIDWILNKRVVAHCQAEAKKIVADVEAKVKEILSTDLELKVKNKLITTLGLEDLLSTAKKIS